VAFQLFPHFVAANRRFHPGEKRLLVHAEELPSVPESMIEDVRTSCSQAGGLGRCVADHLILMRRRLEVWLEGEGLL
jgi:hypothetical protein